MCNCGQPATIVVFGWPMCNRCLVKRDAQTKERSPDFQLIRQGTISLLEPLTDAARAWAEEHIPADATRFGPAIVIEHRYIADILAGIARNRLTLEAM